MRYDRNAYELSEKLGFWIPCRIPTGTQFSNCTMIETDVRRRNSSTPVAILNQGTLVQERRLEGHYRWDEVHGDTVVMSSVGGRVL